MSDFFRIASQLVCPTILVSYHEKYERGDRIIFANTRLVNGNDRQLISHKI
ncbi:unnamed protein product [Blumeria hordei]|uniref:Uncharacterized protein n=1 Tax=Blumeria hordei TaxID=2867405 RepID=A0A383UTT8_BLUHO|nr:unnamed protein product [Blumeria hordei]